MIVSNFVMVYDEQYFSRQKSNHSFSSLSENFVNHLWINGHGRKHKRPYNRFVYNYNRTVYASHLPIVFNVTAGILLEDCHGNIFGCRLNTLTRVYALELQVPGSRVIEPQVRLKKRTL